MSSIDPKKSEKSTWCITVYFLNQLCLGKYISSPTLQYRKKSDKLWDNEAIYRDSAEIVPIYK